VIGVLANPASSERESSYINADVHGCQSITPRKICFLFFLVAGTE
jgi:hypothetical protein